MQLDDTLDHWDAGSHLKERKAFVKRLQHLARARRLRVSDRLRRHPPQLIFQEL